LLSTAFNFFAFWAYQSRRKMNFLYQMQPRRD